MGRLILIRHGRPMWNVRSALKTVQSSASIGTHFREGHHIRLNHKGYRSTYFTGGFRSLGFARTVTKIEDTEFEHICIEFGLEDTIVPAFTIGRHLAELFEERELLELSSMIKDEARVYSFVARAEDAGSADDLGLPKDCRIVCLYRNNKFRLPDDTLVLQSGDEILLITHSRNLEALRDRFHAPVGPNEA